jgi:hypothetical protein
VCAGLQFLSASPRHLNQSCVLSVRGAAQECIDHYGTSGFFASGLDENNDGASTSANFQKTCLGQSEPGNVGLRNMLNGDSSVGQGQWACFTKIIAARNPFRERRRRTDPSLNGSLDSHKHV